MKDVRYFLGDSYKPLRDWDEVSEDTYKAVRANCKEGMPHVFASDSRDDYTKETYFEGLHFLCGARIAKDDKRMPWLFEVRNVEIPEMRLEVRKGTQKFQKITFLEEGTYNDDDTQEMQVVQAFREVRRAMKEGS